MYLDPLTCPPGARLLNEGLISSYISLFLPFSTRPSCVYGTGPPGLSIPHLYYHLPFIEYFLPILKIVVFYVQ